MGQKQEKPIPCEIDDDEGDILTDLDDFMHRCEADYGPLFSGTQVDLETSLYVRHIKRLNEEFENNN